MEKKSNPWLVHVAKYRKENPSLSYKDVLKQAKETYTKVKGSSIVGGAKKEAKPKKEKKGGSISGGSVSGGSVSGGSVSGGAKEKKPRKTRKDKGTKKGGKLFGEDGHGIQKVPVEHVTAELVKQV